MSEHDHHVRFTRVSLLALLALVPAAACVLAVVFYTPRWRDLFRPVEIICGASALLLGGMAAVRVFDLGPRWASGWWQGLGCLMAAASLLVGFFAVFLLPEPCNVRESARRATCKSNLRQIGLACHMYADDHGEWFPPNMQVLVPNYLESPRLLRCPSVPREGWGCRKPDERAWLADPSYTYVGAGLCAAWPSAAIMAYDESLENHDREGHESGRNVLFTDAHVEWWPAGREAGFREKLARQREAVRKWREAGAREQDIGKFCGELGKEKAE